MGDESVESTSLRRLQYSRRERDAYALTLPFVADRERDFRGAIADRAKASERNDFGALGHLQLGHEGEPTPVVHTGQEAENSVRQHRHRRKESEVPRSRAQVAEEFADRKILAPAQRADVKRPTIRQPDVIFELAGISKRHWVSATLGNWARMRRVLVDERLTSMPRRTDR
jgi:hypothetical protein